MSSIGIERDMSGLPIIPVEYIYEVDNVERITDVTSNAASSAAGATVLTSNPIVVDGSTIYEVEMSTCGLGGGAANGIVSLWENRDGVLTDLGVLLRTYTFVGDVERALRYVPAAGVITWYGSLWSAAQGTTTFSAGDWGVSDKNPGRLTVRMIKHGTA